MISRKKWISYILQNMQDISFNQFEVYYIFPIIFQNNEEILKILNEQIIGFSARYRSKYGDYFAG